jgi:hypothetical protein
MSDMTVPDTAAPAHVDDTSAATSAHRPIRYRHARDGTVHTFVVTTINVNGATLSRAALAGANEHGYLHVTADTLTLSRAHMNDVTWPLVYIRRYGYDRRMFSIEAGRRACTGAGVFTFACERAEELFSVCKGMISVRNTPLRADDANKHRARGSDACETTATPRQHGVVPQ